MNKPVPFIASALNIEEFIPLTQDHEHFARVKAEEISKKHAALDGRRLAAEALEDEDARASALDLCDVEFSLIEVERRAVAEKIEGMQKRYPVPQTFNLSVPTALDRDMASARLVSLGLSQVTPELMKAAMIDVVFAFDWGKGPEGNLIEAEEIANFMDEIWQKAEAHNAALDRWREQEVERLADIMEGAPVRHAEEKMPRLISVRDNARMDLLVFDLMKTQRMRDIAAKSQDYNRQHSMLMARMHIVGVNFECGIEVKRDPVSKSISDDMVNAIRAQVDDASWAGVCNRINELYVVSEYERKNSDSPVEKPLPPSGSAEPTGNTESSGGSSTISSTIPAPVAASETITEMPSASGSIASEQPLTDLSPSPTGVL